MVLTHLFPFSTRHLSNALYKNHLFKTRSASSKIQTMFIKVKVLPRFYDTFSLQSEDLWNSSHSPTLSYEILILNHIFLLYLLYPSLFIYKSVLNQCSISAFCSFILTWNFHCWKSQSNTISNLNLFSTFLSYHYSKLLISNNL